MELSAILPHVEALIFASEKPLTSLELTELINNALGFLDDKITLDQIESAVAGVIEKYDADFYPFEIRESGGGWQFLTKKDYHKTVAQLNGDKFLKRLSAASLETLAIIAYKQPITKGEIESIRGVNSDYSIQKLLEKELIIITGRNEEMPGKPLVYATSKTFMDYFGINSPDELPSIKDVLSSQVLEPTQVPQPASDGLFADAGSGEDRPSIDEPLSQGSSDNESAADDEYSSEENEVAINEDSSDELILEDDLAEGDLVVRANGELTDEPEIVIEETTEVIEPEQVIREDEPDDAVAERIEEESGEDDVVAENIEEESGEDDVVAENIEEESGEDDVVAENIEEEYGEDDAVAEYGEDDAVAEKIEEESGMDDSEIVESTGNEISDDSNDIDPDEENTNPDENSTPEKE